ncbi:RGD-containing lipoprotein [Staphylococcus aureus]|nr:RGD-containing lipoprotein [Staphylococcus aureus]
MKKIISIAIIVLALVLSGCGVPTKSEVAQKSSKVEVKGERPTIHFLGQASYENDMNIVKDQLENAGFNVKMNIQPDYGSYRTQRQAGNYDIQIDDWMTVFGDPNYAMTALFSSTGSNSLLKDKHVDQLLNKASTQNEADVKQTYKQIEDEVVFDKGYMAPSIPNLIIALSIGNIPSFARTMRASVLEIKRMEYVDAARITGENTWNIIWRYILPNAIAPMIVRFSLNIGVVVLTTSSLSFLGLGVTPDVAEWGNILRTGSNYLETHSNLAIVPGICIMFVVLAFNFIGDAVRDALDPRIH